MVGRNTETRPTKFEPNGVPPSPKTPDISSAEAISQSKSANICAVAGPQFQARAFTTVQPMTRSRSNSKSVGEEVDLPGELTINMVDQ